MFLGHFNALENLLSSLKKEEKQMSEICVQQICNKRRRHLKLDSDMGQGL